MALKDDSKISISSEVMYKEVSGETVLLDLTREHYYGLDSVGTRVWELIASEGVFGSIVDAMIAEFDVEKDNVSSDLRAILGDLEKEGLVSIS